MTTSCFFKGMGIGLAVGACLGMAMCPHGKCSAKKTMSKAAKAVQTVIEDVSDILGM